MGKAALNFKTDYQGDVFVNECNLEQSDIKQRDHKRAGNKG